MVSLGDKIFVIGGLSGPWSEGNILSDIYQLRCSNCPWSKLDQSLQYARYDFIAMLIPDVITDCGSATDIPSKSILP